MQKQFWGSIPLAGFMPLIYIFLYLVRPILEASLPKKGDGAMSFYLGANPEILSPD
jgi:hypothetical protein